MQKSGKMFRSLHALDFGNNARQYKHHLTPTLNILRLQQNNGQGTKIAGKDKQQETFPRINNQKSNEAVQKAVVFQDWFIQTQQNRPWTLNKSFMDSSHIPTAKHKSYPNQIHKRDSHGDESKCKNRDFLHSSIVQQLINTLQSGKLLPLGFFLSAEA